MSQIKPRDEYNYNVYICSEPFFMLLENDSIIDINLDSKKYIKVHYDDIFFDHNLKGSKKTTFSVVIVTYNTVGQFLRQIDLLGEDLVIEDNGFRLYYEQITDNNMSLSLNPKWTSAIDMYKRERLSYLRDRKIQTILDF